MLRRVAWLWIGIQLAAAAASAQDPALAEIRAVLEPMRGHLPSGARGAPALAGVKHKLRDWIERRLHEFHNPDEARAFVKALNAELLSAKLSCDWNVMPPANGCPKRGESGYLDEITVVLEEALIIKTRVGIICGFDESAYAYYWVNGRWEPFWESETNDYRDGKYVPLNFLGIHLSPRDYQEESADPNARMLLVLARDPAYCESNWYNVYYRVWRLRTDRPEKELLLDGGEDAFVGGWVDGTITPRDVLIEYGVGTTYTDLLVRSMTRHYTLRNGKLVRVAPLALRPQDFADEWLRTPWPVSSKWTSPGADAASLQAMHDKPKNFAGGEYTTTRHCKGRPEHWQVGLEWPRWDDRTKAVVTAKHMYFLMRWLPPYRFSMDAVSAQPWAGCSEEDREADEPRTLFPVHSQQRW